MKYKIIKYQAVYADACRDSIKLDVPIYTDDIESVRTKLKMKHSGIGKKCIGVDLDYEEFNND